MLRINTLGLFLVVFHSVPLGRCKASAEKTSVFTLSDESIVMSLEGADGCSQVAGEKSYGS